MKLNLSNRRFMNQKKKYIFLIGITLVSIVAGILFYFILSKTDQKVIHDLLDQFFMTITSDNLNQKELLWNGVINVFSTSLFIWILGISIIGIPIIILFYFLKSFILGFSISSIISSYGLKGCFRAFLYVFPHQIINLLVLLLLVSYSLSFSVKLIRYLFFHQNINFKLVMKRYLKILFLSIIVFLLSLFYEVFLSTYFFQLLLGK